MSKKKKFQLIYQVETESLEDVIRFIFELISNTGFEPKELLLPDGRKLPWNGYAAHQFAGEGRIDEKQFIEMSMNQE